MGEDIKEIRRWALRDVPFEYALRLAQRRREAEWFAKQNGEPLYIYADILRGRYRTEFIADHLAGMK